MTAAEATGAARLERSIRGASAAGRPALVPFLTAGWPRRDGFADLLARVASEAEAVEIGVPFSDPVADGVTIQRTSREALEAGVTLEWILETLSEASPRVAAPLVLMSYLNPLLALGLDRFAREAAGAGVAGLVVPDLPLEESGPVAEALRPRGIALVRLVTPATPAERLARLAAASRGYVYAVTMTGTTGGRAEIGDAVARYLARVRAASPVPVLAGFGIRDAAQLTALRGHADGAVVGSALLDRLERGEDPALFLRSLREGGAAAGRPS